MIREAKFSNCGQHRLSLTRIWNPDKPTFIYVGLNPSTANRMTDDPTIRRLYGLTDHNGGGGFYMHNLFTVISPKPEALYGKTSSELIHGEWLEHYWRHVIQCTKVVFCWSAIAGRKQLIWRVNDFVNSPHFDNKFCFGYCANGQPKHPLYLPKGTELIPFIPKP